MNPRLRAAIQPPAPRTCRRTTSSAPSRRRQGGDAENYDEIRYEGYGPGGVARDRRGADRQPQPHRRRRALRSSPRTAATSARPARCPSCSTASASIAFDAKVAEPTTMLEAAIEAGADDVVVERGRPRDLLRPGRARRGREGARGAASASRARPRWSGGRRTPSTVDDEAGEKLMRLIDALEDNDDVQNVYANFEVSDASWHDGGLIGRHTHWRRSDARANRRMSIRRFASSASIPASAAPAGAWSTIEGIAPVASSPAASCVSNDKRDAGRAAAPALRRARRGRRRPRARRGRGRGDLRQQGCAARR